MDIRFLDVAQTELDEAIEYYNSKSPGLGDAFLVETLKALERIRHFQKAWHPFSDNTRRCQLNRFPYALTYQLLEKEILIAAVAHLHREPGYWKDRIHE